MSYILTFIAGALLGATVGITLYALCVVGGRSDQRTVAPDKGEQ